MSENLNDLRAFILVAQVGSFTRAAGQLGVSQSALSYTIRTLEERLGVKLLNRTTRSVSPTQAGERLLEDIEPLIAGIDQKLGKLNAFRDLPRGTLRINSSEHVINTLLWDKLASFARDYPDVVLEITTDYAFTDIVKDRFDIGIRLGSTVDKDMVAVRVTPDFQMIVVGSPDYIAAYGIPETPKELNSHRCLTMRLPRHENIMSWEFQNPGKEQPQSVTSYRPQSAIIVSHAHLLMRGAIDGLGLAWVPATMAEQELKSGALTEVLMDWKMTYEGYYMYYPNRQLPPLFRLFVDALKLRVG
ncbi:LysR family transcriptional regulator [Cellvibrio sp. UBA7661]|uniref:LysR family transcriptional regulator n=1 Tax=Cellvibrio sp. UBA7661 TaxID=1946311 RepID=UPI002F356E5F